MHDDTWYKSAVFYEVYVRAFRDSNNDGHGDLRGVIEKLDYLQQLGVTCLWLLPINPSPLKDDGYDVAQHYDIHPDFGTLDDFQALIAETHRRGMRLILDMVLNHTSDQHPWFRAARSNPHSPFREYYVWSDTTARYAEARVIFREAESSNWAWDAEAGQYYWHRFYAAQPDLNYDHPPLRREMMKVISFWLDLGVDGFRCDAVPFLFEREGTNCENLPETHRFLRQVRAHMQRNYPGRILLAEAVSPPQQLRQYFGNGKNEFHMAFHFPLMPYLFMALGKADRAPLETIARLTPRIPRDCQWCNFLRNHDELTLEMLTAEERQWMWDHYAPDPRMRLNFGTRRRLAPLLGGDTDRIRLAHSLLLTLPGSPVLYYGDEIGMGDDIWREDRDGLRTPMQWNAQPGAGFSAAPAGALYAPLIEADGYSHARLNVEQQLHDEGSLLNTIRRMLAVRAEHKSFGLGSFRWVGLGDDSIAAYTRRFEGEHILVVNNLDSRTRQARIPPTVRGRYVELLSGEPRSLGPSVTVQPSQYLWLLRQD